AITALNKNKRVANETNCLIFFSAQLNTNKLPELSPKFASSATIVAVGLNMTDLGGIVKQKGTAVSVHNDFTEDDIDRVVSAVLTLSS
ncbi:hypothetical protein GCK32_020291, partial [Trichostrongylus colubriformis]